jgi:hypothetical protein
MSAMFKIQSAGFILKLVDGNLNVTPTKGALTDSQRQYLKAHKAEIVNELKAEALPMLETFITCGDCLNFKCHNTHDNGAGYCLAGVGFVLWYNSLHECEAFNAAVEWRELPEPKPDAHLVTCYTPNGKVIEIEARDARHVEWLERMNPKRTY